MVNVVNAPESRVHHIAFDLRGTAHHAAAADALRKGGLQPAVGPARHTAGHNFAGYHYDTLQAPIPRPGKILAIGLNYADHVEESKEAGLEIPTEQVWFCKQVTSVNDPDGLVKLPQVSSMLDYEVELVAVIGKAGRHIGRDAAPGHVFGYAVGNDFTVRDWQHRTPQ